MADHARPLTRLLVANRGEIACRIVTTARRLGIGTLALYSDADRGARHVRMADEAYHLGASAAADSYLNMARIVALARRIGADAVHPGYGFLSENAAFAEACLEAGLLFVGPPPAAIRAMGSKSAAKAAMAAVGVPVVPGYHGADQSLERLTEEAARLGFPLIIKASAGGGGKGMQVVESSAALGAAIDAAKRLARAAFGDDRVLLERYFPRARHVEVQVFADRHGTTLALFDRDCSVQRRHQKVIEEAPAPGLRAEVRGAMAQAAVQAAKAVAYESAGTVEFLLDEGQNFYFLEMNTRLQVEHAVTEMVTGIDLVEWQLRVARGEPVPAAAGSTVLRGAAIEARLYAEDPSRDYLPSVGRIRHLRWPAAAPGLRLDVGVDEGDSVSTFYDPMLAKLIAWGESREEAGARLRRALAELEITGVRTNRALLAGILADEAFRKGDLDTGFILRRRAALPVGEPAASPTDLVLAAVWLASRATSAALWQDTGSWRLGTPAVAQWRFREGVVALERLATHRYAARLAAEALAGGAIEAPGVTEVHVIARLDRELRAEIGGEGFAVSVIDDHDTLHLFRRGAHLELHPLRTEDALVVSAGHDAGSLLTPLPGTIVAVHVEAGAHVARGAPLVTVEAMKMEHTLTAPQAGVIARIPFGIGMRVPAGAVLVELNSP